MPTRRQVVLPPERTISPPFAPSHAATASTHRLVSVVRTRPRLTGDACAADGVNLFGSWRRTWRICSKTVSPRQPARGVSSSPIRSVGLAPSEPPKARVLQRTPSALSPGPPHPRTHPIEWAECVESQVRPPPHAARPSRTPAPTGGLPSLAGCDAFYHSCVCSSDVRGTLWWPARVFPLPQQQMRPRVGWPTQIYSARMRGRAKTATAVARRVATQPCGVVL